MFLQNKYTNWYFSIIEKAKSKNRIKLKRNDPNFIYYESHHIIPKCFGGTEEVLLLPKEHFVCHLLLCRMTHGQQKHKMINALIKMTFNKGKFQERYTARSFDLVRKLIAEKNSEMFKGVPKSDKCKQNMKGSSGTWKRSDTHKERMRGKNNPMFGFKGELNPSSRPEIRKKISNSKLGRKRIYRLDGTYYYERKIINGA